MFIRRFAERAVAFSLAAVLTLGMLGGIDRLAAPDSAADGWAAAPAATTTVRG